MQAVGRYFKRAAASQRPDLLEMLRGRQGAWRTDFSPWAAVLDNETGANVSPGARALLRVLAAQLIRLIGSRLRTSV